jgi:hypothetical protein
LIKKAALFRKESPTFSGWLMDYPDNFWIVHWFKMHQKRPALHQALVKFRTTGMNGKALSILWSLY